MAESVVRNAEWLRDLLVGLVACLPDDFEEGFDQEVPAGERAKVASQVRFAMEEMRSEGLLGDEEDEEDDDGDEYVEEDDDLDDDELEEDEEDEDDS